MQMTSLVLTTIADDRPGLVETLASIVARHDGNWIESSMSRLAGAFAGIVRIEVPQERARELQDALGALADQGIAVTVKQADTGAEHHGQAAHVSLMCQDHPGILHALATVFAGKGREHHRTGDRSLCRLDERRAHVPRGSGRGASRRSGGARACAGAGTARPET